MLDRFIGWLKNWLKAFLQNRNVRRFAETFPKTYQFVINRFSLDKFTGLPLTFLLAAFLSNLYLLSELNEHVVNSLKVTLIDNYFAHLFYDYRNPILAKGLYYFTQVCNPVFVPIAALVLGIMFIFMKKYAYSLAILISLAGSGLSAILGKNFYKINRPTSLSYYPEISFSYPSGHATLAIAFYGILFYFIVKKARRIKTRSALFISWVIFAGLVGFSRIYLCEHYVSDVIGGYFLGALWLISGICIVEYHHKKYKLV